MHHNKKVIINRRITPDWKNLPQDIRKEYAVRKKGDSPPGLRHMEIIHGMPSGYFEEDSQVNIVADLPTIGKRFDKWVGDITTVDNVNLDEAIVTIPPGDVLLEATYIDEDYTLVVDSGNGDGVYNYNDIVHLEADAPPNPTMEFNEWVGDVATIADVTNPISILIMPATNIFIMGLYTDIMYQLDITDGSGDGMYLINSIIDIVADAPPLGKKFTGWAGDISEITSPHLSETTIRMRDNYTIHAMYADIISIDPDATNVYFDIPNTPKRETYNNNEMNNTPIDMGLDRYFDIAQRNSRITFTDIEQSVVIPGGGTKPIIDLPLSDTLELFNKNILPDDTFRTISQSLTTPGGGNRPIPNLPFSDIMDLQQYQPFIVPQDTITQMISYSPPDHRTEIIADAITLVQSGFIGGSVVLGSIRDNSIGNTGIYTSTPIGDYIGVEFPGNVVLDAISWYSLWRGSRIAGFIVERYAGGVWIKVPITGVSSDVSIVDVDEGSANNVDGWKTVTFAQTEDTQFRIKVISKHAGDSNCGVSEMRFYKIAQ